MDEIVTGVKRVSDIISGITTASREQLTGIGQVNTAITQMTGATQQNAAVVQQSSAAADNLSDQAQALIAVVARFKLQHHANETGEASARRRPPQSYAAAEPTRPLKNARAGSASEPLPTQAARQGEITRRRPAQALPGKADKGNTSDGGWKEF